MSRRVRILLAVVCGFTLCFLAVLSKSRRTPAEGLPSQLRSVQGYRSSNAPTANLQAAAQPFSAVTNQTIKELIAATGRFRAANSPPATPPGRKLYTVEQPLPGQVATLQRLQATSGGTLQAYLRPESHVPVQLKGHPLAEPDPALVGQPNGDELMAKRFLQANRDVLLLDRPDDELRLNHRETDKLGRTVLRFSQFYRGLEVWPGEIGVQSDATGAIDLVHTTTVPTPEGITLTPRITAEQATQRARASVPGGISGTTTEPKLLIYAPLDQAAKLAWKLELSFGLDQHWQVVVDAQTGSNLKSVNMCMCANVAGSGVDLLGVTRPLNLDQQGSLYYMRNLSKPMFNPATGNGIIVIEDAANGEEPSYQVSSSSPNSWVNPDAISAAFNLSAVYDYYYQRHSRNSFNGLGSNLFAVVRYHVNFANAFWNPVQKLMVFGDADRYPASLDVTGHEVTHGVISSIGSKPILDYVNQSGALNESFSDIFGEMTEAQHNGGMPDWIIGSVLNQKIRNMSNPPAIAAGGGIVYPRKMADFVALPATEAEDKGGVHINSSIINRAYYLIASGLSGSLGIPDSEAIFYRCLTTKFLPQSQFIDARLGCIASAEELFGVGSRQALKVAEGFDAIELFASPVNVPQSSTNLPSVSAPDSTMWVYPDPSISNCSLARYEEALGDPGNGIRIATSAKITRPSVSGGGALVAFVTTDNSLALLDTTGGIPILSATGRVSTMTFSPLADRAAFVVLSNGQPPIRFCSWIS
jgi:bacillolysin